jgi:hypothetical protein
MLQSLAFEPTYKSAYCMAVCPAGEDVIGAYLTDKAQYREKVLLPLRQHPEPVYVQLPGMLRITFRFPDGSLLASVENGRLTTGPVDSLAVDATVACDAPDYIRILHRPAARRPGYAAPASYTVDGDSSAFQHLLACLQ